MTTEERLNLAVSEFKLAYAQNKLLHGHVQSNLDSRREYEKKCEERWASRPISNAKIKENWAYVQSLRNRKGE